MAKGHVCCFYTACCQAACSGRPTLPPSRPERDWCCWRYGAMAVHPLRRWTRTTALTLAWRGSGASGRLMGVADVVMVGQSFGAGLAMHYAIRHPQRVRALVITKCISAFNNPCDDGPRQARERMASEIEAGGAAAIRSLPMHPRHAKRIPQDIKARPVAATDAVDPVAVVRSIRLTAPQTSVARLLHHIACPVLLVNGRNEAGFQRYRDIAAAGIARCEVVDLVAGHAVNLEAAMAFDQAVLDFLSRT